MKFVMVPPRIVKFVMVPPGLVEPMLAALRFEGVDVYAEHGELPPIGGIPVLVSRHCAPGTGYILHGEQIPDVKEKLWRNEYLGSWVDVEEPPTREPPAYTFSIDYAPFIVETAHWPKLTRWQRLRNWLSNWWNGLTSPH